MTVCVLFDVLSHAKIGIIIPRVLDIEEWDLLVSYLGIPIEMGLRAKCSSVLLVICPNLLLRMSTCDMTC